MPTLRLLLDVGSPFSYLAAERAESVLGAGVAFEPVLLGGIFAATGRSSWSQTDARAAEIAEIERRAARYGLPPLVWPDPWPGNGLPAMRAAVAADLRGAGRAFLLAAFRAAFRDGRDVAERATIGEIAVSAGLDADELLGAIDDPAVKAALRARTDAALALGVMGVPTVVVGEDALGSGGAGGAGGLAEGAGRSGAAGRSASGSGGGSRVQLFWGDDRLEAAAAAVAAATAAG